MRPFTTAAVIPLDEGFLSIFLASNAGWIVPFALNDNFTLSAMNLSLIDPFVLAQDYPDTLAGTLSMSALMLLNPLLFIYNGRPLI